MRSEQLEYLIAIEKLSTIRQVADKYHISPSAVSMALTQLEDELEMKIFERGRNGTILTKAGIDIANITKMFFSNINTVKAQNKLGSTKNHKFIFPFITTHGFLFEILPAFEHFLSEISDDVCFDKIISLDYIEQLKQVYSKELPFSIIYFLDNFPQKLSDDFIFEHFATGKLFGAFNNKSIKDIPKSLSLNKLKEYNIVMYSDNTGPFYEFVCNVVRPAKILFAESISAYFEKVYSGNVIGLQWIPEYDAAVKYIYPSITITPIDTNTKILFGMLYRKDNQPQGADKEIIDLFKIFVDKYMLA